jgi:hypothetical protein
VWRACPNGSAEKRFVQGLVLVSAAILQRFAGRPAGTRRLRAKALACLAPALALAPDADMGIALRAWAAGTADMLERLALGAPIDDGAALPVIRLSEPRPLDEGTIGD